MIRKTPGNEMAPGNEMEIFAEPVVVFPESDDDVVVVVDDSPPAPAQPSVTDLGPDFNLGTHEYATDINKASVLMIMMQKRNAAAAAEAEEREQKKRKKK